MDTLSIIYLHPGKLTWNLRITHVKRKNIFQTFIFGFHVKFRGCNLFKSKELTLHSSIKIISKRRKIAFPSYHLQPFQAVHPLLQGGGPLPVISGVITPISGLINGVTDVITLPYTYNWFSGAHIVNSVNIKQRRVPCDWYIILYLPYKPPIHVGKYTKSMDPTVDGSEILQLTPCKQWDFN